MMSNRRVEITHIRQQEAIRLNCFGRVFSAPRARGKLKMRHRTIWLIGADDDFRSGGDINHGEARDAISVRMAPEHMDVFKGSNLADLLENSRGSESPD